MRKLSLAMASFSGVALSAAASTRELSDALEPLKPENVIPDHVSIERGNAFFWPPYKRLGVKIDGVIRRGDVVEFCVSEGWAMVQVMNSMGVRVPDPATNGKTFLLKRVIGKIEPYWIAKDQKAAGPDAASALASAEIKRQLRAEKRRKIMERETAHG